MAAAGGKERMEVQGEWVISRRALNNDFAKNVSYTLRNNVSRKSPNGFVLLQVALAICAHAAVFAIEAPASESKNSAAPTNAPLSFVRDVLPVMSKAGCNAGKCHAKPAGQNGFKLSVFAYDPQSDYEQIVKAAHGRRVFPSAPDSSLILLKPTMAVNHGGGKRLEPGSPFYQVITEWLRQGMPYRQPNEPSLTRIEVTPAEAIYKKAATTNLTVRAVYSDGSSRDVTHLADYSSTEKELAEVDEQGLISVGKLSGETVLIIRYMGLVANSRVTVPSEQALPASFYAGLPANNEIDRLVYAQLKKLGYAPSDLCTDAEFIRRASLDIIGLLPSPEETKSFLDQTGVPTQQKRRELVQRLLEHPNYANYWADKWGDLIRPNTVRVGIKTVYLFDQWLRDSFRQNKPYNEFVRELLTVQKRSDEYGPAAAFRDRREPQDAATWVSQIFLGVRMECAKCHHHPNEKWSQQDFYQLAAFFGDMKFKGRGVGPPISAGWELVYFGPGGGVKHPVTGETMKPTPPDGPACATDPEHDTRSLLVDWMERADNPFFARALVNRIWGELLGRGMVDPVDDFRSSNLPTNEPLLDWLAKDFVAHKYDLKHLIATIMESRVYQLSSIPNEHNIEDTRNYSHALRRRLPAEVLLDAVADVTGVPTTFEGLPPGSRASEAWNQRLHSEFMDAFGRPNASADCPCERDRRTSLVQALHLMNSRDLQEKIASDDGRAHQLADSKLTPEAIVTDLYLRAYSRTPSSEELQIAAKAFSAPESNRRTASEDVLWALLNSAEFVFNH